ncbi:Teichuronic acid biosynthesis protein TuaB [Planctomycetes bacterium MalM25]|nr:Teichuronic acid biosynthesis protein TuaB [Planctomycetes bacterium MalM25]
MQAGPRLPATDYFSHERARQDLMRKTVRGGAAAGVAQVAGIVIQVISIPILSRLLGPDDFGVVNMAVIFTGFGQLLIDSGFASATVQRDDLTRQQASNLFWIATAAGVSLAAMLSALSVPISWWFAREEVAAIIVALSLPFVLAGMTIQHQALLRRNMRFGELAMIRIGGVLLSQSVTIGCAYAWRSYWALVVGQITLAAFSMLATWCFCRWRPGLPARGAGTRSLVEFGANLTLAKFINYLTRTADRALIGSFIDAATLGFYDRAFKCLLFPVQNINGPSTSVMVPALSRLKEQPERYSKAYLTALTALATVVTPLVTVAAIDSERLIPLILGDLWRPSIPIFQALIPAAYLAVFSSVFSWIYVSQGRGVDQVRWQIINGVATLAGVVCGLRWGAVGVAWGFSASRLIVMPIGFWLSFRGAPMTIPELLQAIRPVALSALTAAGAGLNAKAWAPERFALSSWGSTLMLAALTVGVFLATAQALGLPKRVLTVLRRK